MIIVYVTNLDTTEASSCIRRTLMLLLDLAISYQQTKPCNYFTLVDLGQDNLILPTKIGTNRIEEEKIKPTDWRRHIVQRVWTE